MSGVRVGTSLVRMAEMMYCGDILWRKQKPCLFSFLTLSCVVCKIFVGKEEREKEEQEKEEQEETLIQVRVTSKL